MSALLTRLTGTQARTFPTSPDPRLRGRTYAISFDRVWTAALTLAGRELARWEVIDDDDQAGVINAVATTWPGGKRDEVQIRVGLDPNGQTRVDLSSSASDGKRDLGRNARRIHVFLRKLDARLDAGAAQILDPTLMPSWTS